MLGFSEYEHLFFNKILMKILSKFIKNDIKNRYLNLRDKLFDENNGVNEVRRDKKKL